MTIINKNSASIDRPHNFDLGIVSGALTRWHSHLPKIETRNNFILFETLWDHKRFIFKEVKLQQLIPLTSKNEQVLQIPMVREDGVVEYDLL